MFLELILGSPASVVVALLAAVVLHFVLNLGKWRTILLELRTTDWYNLLFGFAMSNKNGMGTCEACGTAASLRCARCKTVRYCSIDCQRRHWRTGHKEECGKPAVILSAAEIAQRKVLLQDKVTESCPAAEEMLFPYNIFIAYYADAGRFRDPNSYAPAGMINVGNTCYANSVLQCLFATPHIRAFLHEFAYSPPRAHMCCAVQQHPQLKDWSLIAEVQKLLKDTAAGRGPVSTRPLLARVSQIGRHLTFGRQEDSHDFLLTLLDAMETELLEAAGGKDSITDLRTRETTFVFHSFGGYMRNQVECFSCGYVSRTFESVLCLALEISGHVSSIQAALDLHCGDEMLEGLNKYECDCCQNKVRAKKTSRIEAAPNILVLVLKRFSVGRFGKLNKKVSYPSALNLDSFKADDALDNAEANYSLYGVVVHLDHMNSTTFGHYIAYVKGADGRWWLCDDSSISQASASKVLSQNAYMLFYMRDPGSPKPPPLLKHGGWAGPGCNGGSPSAVFPDLVRRPDSHKDAKPRSCTHHETSRAGILERTLSSPAALTRSGAAHLKAPGGASCPDDSHAVSAGTGVNSMWEGGATLGTALAVPRYYTNEINTGIRGTRAAELVVELPEVESVQQVDVQLETDAMSCPGPGNVLVVEAAGKYLVRVPLGSALPLIQRARFSRRSKLLRVKLAGKLSLEVLEESGDEQSEQAFGARNDSCQIRENCECCGGSDQCTELEELNSTCQVPPALEEHPCPCNDRLAFQSASCNALDVL